ELEQSTLAKVDVLARQRDDFRHACSAVIHGQQESVVPSTYPQGAVRRSKEGLHLFPGEVPDQLFVLALAGDGQYPGSDPHAFGLAQGHEPKERAQRREANVAGADLVAALLFQIVQKGENHWGIEIGQPQGGGLDTHSLLHKVQQETEGVTTASNGLWTET